MHTPLLATVNLNTKLEMPSLTHFKDTIGAPKLNSGSCEYDHAHCGVVCHPRLVLVMVYLCTKFEDCCIIRSKDTTWVPKFRRSRNAYYAPFRGDLLS